MTFPNPALLVAALMLATGAAAVTEAVAAPAKAEATEMQALRVAAGQASYVGQAVLTLAQR